VREGQEGGEDGVDEKDGPSTPSTILPREMSVEDDMIDLKMV